MERRLAAIFAADMVGYSRMIEADEVGTLTRQKLHRSELIDPRIEQHGGRIIKLTGDGMIAEFPSVVEAVQCAVSVQREMAAHEADVPEDRRIRYRIAVNLGDVIFDEGDVYGDGVNIAARLEGLAEPGGVVVSGTAFDHLKANVEVGYEDLGEQQVKNIATPVRVYRVVPDGVGKPVPMRPTRRRNFVPIAAVAILALVIAAGGWWWLQRPEFTPADPARMEYALDEPSIAVLAFDNLTGDPEQEHVSDGISEDIISTLARLPGVVVIARNSSFSYKGKPVDVRQVAEEMSVRYVLEGSLQSLGDQVRITAQLIDAVSGRHVWARKFDRPRADFFKVRDEIAFDIIAELNSELLDGHTVRASRTTFKSVDAWLLGRKMLQHAFRFNRADNEIAIEIGQKILQMDPDAAVIHSLLAFRFAWKFRANWSDDPKEALRRAEAYAEKAISLDRDSSVGYSALGFIRYMQGRIDEAISLSKQALERAPGDAEEFGVARPVLAKGHAGGPFCASHRASNSGKSKCSGLGLGVVR